MAKKRTMDMKRSASDARHAEVRKLIAEGKSRKEVCEIIGYTKQNISLILGSNAARAAIAIVEGTAIP